MAVLNERMQRLHLFFERRLGIEAMELIEIDVVHAQPLKTGLARLHQMVARRAPAIWSGSCSSECLRGDHHFVSGNPEVPERMPQHGFGRALGIDIRSVDEIDTGIDCGLYKRIRTVLTDLSDCLPHAFAAVECHCSQAEFGDLQA